MAINTKAGGKVDEFWNEEAQFVRMNMVDADNEKSNDDELVKKLYNVKTSKRFGEKTIGMSSFGSFQYTKEGEKAPEDTLEEVNPKQELCAQLQAQPCRVCQCRAVLRGHEL